MNAAPNRLLVFRPSSFVARIPSFHHSITPILHYSSPGPVLRIAIDCRTVTAPKTGDRTYALNLIRGLAAVDAENHYLLYTAEPTGLTHLEKPNFEPVVLPASPAWWLTPFTFTDDLGRSAVSAAHVQHTIPLRSPGPQD